VGWILLPISIVFIVVTAMNSGGSDAYILYFWIGIVVFFVGVALIVHKPLRATCPSPIFIANEIVRE
jgi:tellurite resistance protein TehA-like permease